jgi:hypothetical protein
MEQIIQDHCVKSAIVSLPPTIIAVATKYIIERSVTPALEKHIRQLSLHQHGNELDMSKVSHVKCVDSLHSIHIN